PYAGRLSDKIKPAYLASFGMLLTVFGLILLTFTRQSTPLLFFIIALILLGVGFGFFSAPNTNAVMTSVSNEYYGIASGILSSMRILGQVISMAIVLLFFNMILGPVKITNQNLLGFIDYLKYSFLLFAILSGIGVFFSLARCK
ncbi:MAG TPA: MFS transporter, partial [bacterium]|nr:MFS transporter [bacterium]